MRLVFPCAVCTCSSKRSKTPGDWSIFSHKKNAIFTSEFVFEKPSSAPAGFSSNRTCPLTLLTASLLGTAGQIRSTRGRRYEEVVQGPSFTNFDMPCSKRLSRLISSDSPEIHAVWTLKMFAGDPQIDKTMIDGTSQDEPSSAGGCSKNKLHSSLPKASLGSWKAWEARCSGEDGS